MKIIVSLALITTLLSASSVVAQTRKSILRAGEHVNFTRVVLTNELEKKWSITERLEEFDLIFEDKTVEVDLSLAFDRIPRTRIREMLPLLGGVRVLLACPCPIRITEGVGPQIVVDVLSPMPPTPGGATSGKRPASRPEFREVTQIPQRAGIALAEKIRKDLPISKETHNMDGWNAQNYWLRIAPEEPQSEVKEAKQERSGITRFLVSTISDAVAQNTLVATSEFSSENSSEVANLDPMSLMHIKTPDEFSSRKEHSGSMTCSSALSALVDDWSENVDQYQTSSIVSSLYNPVDDFDVYNGEKFLSHMFRLGMGAEIRTVLDLFSDAPWFGAALNASFILDSEPAPQRGLLAGFHMCSDEDALWAFLDDPKANWINFESLRAVLRALVGLNATLRMHIGPHVVKQLTREGFEQEAKVAQNALGFVVSDDGDMDSIYELTLERNSELTLAPSITGAFNEISDLDLLFILDWANEKEKELPTDILDLAQDRQFLHRRGALSARFSESTSLALAFAGKFPAAFLLARSDAELPVGRQASLLENLLQILLSNANDSDFLVNIYEQKPWAQPDLPVGLAIEIGRRLEQLGFIEDAIRVTKTQERPNSDQASALASAPADTLGSSLDPSRADSPVAIAPEAAPAINAMRLESARDIGIAAPNGEIQTNGRTVLTAEYGTLAEPSIAPILQGLPDDPGLLTQSRAILSSSEVLRGEVQALFGAGRAGNDE